VKWFTKAIAFILVASFILLMLVISIWLSLPSLKDYEFIAKSGPQYAAVFLDRNGAPLYSNFRIQSQSQYTPLDSVPDYFLDYLVFFEDKSFWYNPGFNPLSALRSAFLHLLGDQHAGGASTITQQVVRLTTGFMKETYWRKLVEIVGAVKLSFTMSKRQILETYLNTAPFGTGSYVGIGAAAKYYFSKRPSELTPAESVMLISFLSHPPGNINENQDRIYYWYHKRVQRLLKSAGSSRKNPFVSEYFSDPVFDITPVNETRNGIFIDRAYDNAARILLKNPDYGLDYSGLTVVTTLDKATNDTVQEILGNVLHRYPGAKGSFILLDQNEEPIVYTLSYPTKRGDFDLINAGGSLPASRMKFPIYAFLVEKLRSTEELSGRKIFDMLLPTSYRVSSRLIIQDGSREAYIPLHRAFALSSNAGAYFIVNRILSPAWVVNELQAFGIHLQPFPSIALGSQPVSELSLCGAYDAITLRNGFFRQPSFVRRILDKRGMLIYQNDEVWPGRQELSSETCAIVKELLREASDLGTSRALSSLRILDAHDYGAKTGTGKQDKQLGVTGFLDNYCFSLHMERKTPFPGEAQAVAVPVLAKILRVLVERGY